MKQRESRAASSCGSWQQSREAQVGRSTTVGAARAAVDNNNILLKVEVIFTQPTKAYGIIWNPS